MNTMLNAALNLLTKQGFSVIPLRRDTKRPYLASWKEFQKRLPTEEEAEAWWRQWPDANIGIVTGEISGLVVVDADGTEGLAWMKAHLPVTSVYVQTGKGWHGYYRHPAARVGNAVRIAPEVDIRADGGYVVAPPSIHASGVVYEWLFTPGLGGWDGLAMYPAAPHAGMDLAGVKPMVTTDPVPVGARNSTLASLVGQWVQQGMAPEVVTFAAMGWNAALPAPLPEPEVRRTVTSVLATHARNHPEQDSPEVEVVEVRPQEQESSELPEHLLHPGGYLEQVMNYIEASNAVYHPVFALAGALAMLGTLIGQKVCTETGLRTNIYAVCLGFSGAGKNAPNLAIPRLLGMSHAANCFAGNGFTSESALLRHLSDEQRACGIAIFDEIGLLLNALKSPNNVAYTLPHCLMKLYSSTQSGYHRAAACEQNTINIKWHHFSFLGFSTPVRFWEAITAESSKDGFLARCDIFDSRTNGINRDGTVDTAIPYQLINTTNSYANMAVPTPTTLGNLINIPTPRIVPKTAEAAAWFKPFAKKYRSLRIKYQATDEAKASIYNRVAERAHKLALIHALSMQGPNAASVGIESVQWACALVEALTENTIIQMTEHLAENDFHRLELKTLAVIRNFAAESKDNSCPAWQISRNIKGIPPKLQQDALQKLENAGEIIKKLGRMYKGKPSYSYSLARLVHDA